MTDPVFKALFDALKDEYGSVSQSEMAEALGVSTMTINNWVNGKTTPNKTNLSKIIVFFREHAASSLIRPILEFTPIAPVRAGKQWNFSASTAQIARIKKVTKKIHGIYVFYDSSGKAVYLGKTENCLYTESKQRLKAQPFVPIYVPAKPRYGEVAERACFVSYYQVAITSAVKNIESFMLRAFTNDLQNRNSGHFTGVL